MEESSEIVIESKKKPSRRKYIIAAGIIFLLITPIFIFILLSQNQKPDPESERVIREAVAKQLNKDPSELTDEDFTKITQFRLSEVSLCDIKLLKRFINLNELELSAINVTNNNTPKWMTFLAKLSIGDLSKRNSIDFNIPLITNARVASAFIYAVCKIDKEDITIKSWEEYSV